MLIIIMYKICRLLPPVIENSENCCHNIQDHFHTLFFCFCLNNYTLFSLHHYQFLGQIVTLVRNADGFMDLHCPRTARTSTMWMEKNKCSLTSTSRMNTSFPVSEIFMFLVFLSVVAMKLCKELLMRRLIHVRTFHVGFIKINCALACHDWLQTFPFIHSSVMIADIVRIESQTNWSSNSSLNQKMFGAVTSNVCGLWFKLVV